MAVEDDVDALYAADPDEFVEARQALVKRLRSDGEREQAAEVAKLRRPTAAAWAVNQLARHHPDDLAALVERGRELHRAHERLLAGGRDDDTVATGRRRREAIADLVERAAGLLAESGRAADAHRDAIASTLDAASLDPDRGREVVAGRLSKELDPPSGFGLGGEDELVWAVPAPPPPPAAKVSAAPKKAAAARKAGAAKAPDDDRAEQAQRAAAERARRAEEAKRRAVAARAAATRARDLADQAQDAADHAERERERLEEEVVRARRTATDSRRTARELRDAAREAERQATALEQEAGS